MVMLLMADGSSLACNFEQMRALLLNGDLVSLRFLGVATRKRRALGAVCDVDTYRDLL